MKTNGNMWNAKGIWLKGNTHTHTVNSDGACTPGEIASEYNRHGYDFVFLTDHEKRTAPDKTIRKPLLIPAEETGCSYKGYGYHFVCLGLKKEWAAGSCRSPVQVLARARREGVFVVQAHPYWCGIPSNMCVYQGGLTCPGVEVYNKVCDRGIAKGYSSAHWDDLLDAGHRILGFAVDDAHLRSDIAGGWIMVKARNRTPEAILAAIRHGSFYSSQGPEIKSIVICGWKITITCSPVVRINFVGNRNYGNVVRARGKRLTEAEWDIPIGVNYVRIECVDRNGKIAWSNPVWLNLDNRVTQKMKRRTLQTAVAPKARGNPLNGDLSKVDWPAAHVLTHWRSLRGDPTRRKVEARLIHDDRYLYIRLEERLDPRRLVVTHYNSVWNEDEWELFFAKQPGRPYRQMGINANGIHLDLAYGETPGIWKSDAVVVSNTRLPDRWQVQIALPLARLVRGGARPGQKIYLNIIRSTEAQHALGWIPTFGGYHEPSRLGAVLLK